MKILQTLMLPVVFPTMVFMTFFQDFYYTFLKAAIEIEPGEMGCGIQYQKESNK